MIKPVKNEYIFNVFVIIKLDELNVETNTVVEEVFCEMRVPLKRWTDVRMKG